MLRDSSSHADTEPRWVVVCLRWTRWCLTHRGWTLLAAGVFLVGSLALVPLLPTGFIPADDLSQTQVTVSLPPGSTFEQTLEAAERARALVERNPHVKRVYTAVGGGMTGADPFAAAGAPDVRTATLTINHVIFVDSACTADYQTTTGILKILDNNGNSDDLTAFMSERFLPLDDIQAHQLAEEVLRQRPAVGYLTISNALQWRLQYKRVIDQAGKVAGVHRVF